MDTIIQYNNVRWDSWYNVQVYLLYQTRCATTSFCSDSCLSLAVALLFDWVGQYTCTCFAPCMLPIKSLFLMDCLIGKLLWYSLLQSPCWGHVASSAVLGPQSIERKPTHAHAHAHAQTHQLYQHLPHPPHPPHPQTTPTPSSTLIVYRHIHLPIVSLR